MARAARATPRPASGRPGSGRRGSARPGSGRPGSGRRSAIAIVASIAAAAALVGGAAIAQGYDAQRVDTVRDAVWVMRDAGQYARVNTTVGQIDTVRDAEDPAEVLQHDDDAQVLTDGLRTRWTVDPSDPKALIEHSASASASGSSASGSSGQAGAARTTQAGSTTPNGTRKVVSSGDWAAYLTAQGKVFLARLSATGTAAQPRQIDPYQGTAKKGSDASYAATAVAISDDGQVAMYSAKEGAVRRYRAADSSFVGGAEKLQRAPGDDDKVALTIVAGTWVLAQAGKGRVWSAGHDSPTSIALGSEAVAERGAPAGSDAYFADQKGLVRVALRDGTAKRIVSASGAPAAPTVVAGAVYAAWLGQSLGRMWSSATGEKSLAVPDGKLAQSRSISPVIQTSGEHAVLNETGTGLLWTIPGGRVIPLSEWDVDKRETTQITGEAPVEDVAQEEPPVAEPDSFGVRAGELVDLPVLLNDHDPNRKDVLTIVGSSVSGLSDPGFGSLSLTGENQRLVVDVRSQSGEATFTYSVSDGQQVSPPATVSLHIVPASQNSAPVWCGVEGCLATWPSVTIAAGGTVSVPVIEGWVDPDGDAIALLSAVKDDPRAPITVVATGDGRVAIRHTDPNAGSATIGVTVTVIDAQGATSTKLLSVVVASSPALEAKQVAVAGTVGQTAVVDIDDHVTGGSGSYRLVDAVASSGASAALTVTPNAAAGTVTLAARAAGEYVIAYTVQDAQTQSEQGGDIRFSVASSPPPFSVPPLTAFVRAQEDTTLDVLAAVQDPGDRVLAISSATTTDAALSVSVVGSSQLRVSGTTTDGKPGRVGIARYTIADGTGATATGQVTVFLVDRETGSSPIAQPDEATVRAGSEIDIPVTANDIAPRGEQLILSPTVTFSESPGELAFVSGQTLRYLAPAKAGTYTVRYSVALAGDPQRTDSAAVTITVVAPGTNHPPEPPSLTARVVAGQSVSVPVPVSSADPDGDTASVSDVTQPKAGSGTVRISADGASLIYTAPDGGVPDGQAAFDYTLTDPSGAHGSGSVTVAVLTGQDDTAPITYADAVTAVAGDAHPLTVEPMLNDRDPSGGSLKLISIVPNAPDVPGNTEYARLKGLIASTDADRAKGIVKLDAGSVVGVQSYIYTVESTRTTSTAQGLIVVTVADEAQDEAPQITDTVLTVADRAGLAGGGIDVVTGKTVWTSGDPSSLRLSLWGEAAKKYTVSGTRIRGTAPDSGALIPFELTGTGAAGGKVEGYGLLRVPAFDDMRLQLKDSLVPTRVGEEQSVTIPIRDAVDLGPGDALEVKSGAGIVQRAKAKCTVSGSSEVYSAGRDEPWTDSCTVLVRVAGQHTWTALPLPLTIVPKAPQAILSPISRTIAPGAEQTIDLYRDLTSWEGGRVGSLAALDYHVALPASGNFEFSQQGNVLTVSARADAHPGVRETVSVAVTSFGGLSTTISLVVGIAPPDAPRGATMTAACTVSQGASCTVPVVGVSGEYDPFAGKSGSGLKLVGIGATSCPVASIAVADTRSITATWPSDPKPPGGSCVVPFTVSDAQGRVGPGTLSLDVLGYPAAPDSVTTASYTGTTVTLLVTLGEAALAHPALRTVRVYEGATPAPGQSCAPGSAGTYQCTVSGLVNGQQHTYTVRAVNSVGESADTTPVGTSAYQAPVVTSVTATTVYDPAQTTDTRGVAEVSVASGDDTRSFDVWTDTTPHQSVDRTGDTTVFRLNLPVGAQTVHVRPISQYQPPIGTDNGGATASTGVAVAGAPVVTNGGQLTPTSNDSAQFQNVAFSAQSAPGGVKVAYAIWPSDGGSEPGCSMASDGSPDMAGAQSSPTFTGLTSFTRYTAKACAANGFGAVATTSTTLIVTNPPSPGDSLSYTIATAPALTTSTTNGRQFTTGASYAMTSGPAVSPPARTTAYFRIYGSGFDQTSFQPSAAQAPVSPAVRYCLNAQPSLCGSAKSISAATAVAPVIVSVSTTCVDAKDIFGHGGPQRHDVQMSAAVQDSEYDVVTSVSTDDNGNKTASYAITFSGTRFGDLAPVTLTRCSQ